MLTKTVDVREIQTNLQDLLSEEEEVIRIISARKATKHERRAYEEG